MPVQFLKGGFIAWLEKFPAYVCNSDQENEAAARRYRECRICCENPVDALIQPCGHAIACRSCLESNDRCIECNGEIADNIPIHIPQEGEDDECIICTDTFAESPAIKLNCGHAFHYDCCRRLLEARWPGPRITFGFTLCPICKQPIDHPALQDVLTPIRELHEEVKRKAETRLEYDGLTRSAEITTPGGPFHNKPAEYAMNRYAYYMCARCKKAYYGGEARCDAQANADMEYNPDDLV